MSLKSKFARSSFWLVVGASAGQLSSFSIFVVLARLLTPAEFGIVAFASIFIEISRQIVSAGMPEALVCRSAWDDDYASTAFWTAAGLGLLLTAVCAGLGRPILTYFNYAEVASVFVVLTVTLPIDGMKAILDAKLKREFNFKLITSREVAIQIVAGCVGIVAALYGVGAWALVINRVLASLLGLVATFQLVQWCPRIRYSRTQAADLFRFSSGLMAAQLGAMATAQVAPLIIASTLGPTALALFRAGNRLLNMLTQLSITPLQGAALSAFARLKGSAELASTYLRLTSACSFVACPIFIGVGAMATDLVVVLLGTNWREAGTIMAVSSLLVGASALNYFFTPALTAAGSTQYASRYYLAAAAGNAALALASAPYGVVAVAASQTARAYAMLPMPLHYLRRVIGLSPLEALRSITPPLLASLTMGAIMVSISRFSWLPDMQPLLRVAVLGMIGAVSYLMLMFVFARRFLMHNLAELKPLLPSFIRAKLP